MAEFLLENFRVNQPLSTKNYFNQSPTILLQKMTPKKYVRLIPEIMDNNRRK